MEEKGSQRCVDDDINTSRQNLVRNAQLRVIPLVGDTLPQKSELLLLVLDTAVSCNDGRMGRYYVMYVGGGRGRGIKPLFRVWLTGEDIYRFRQKIVERMNS